jgi:hypothetical protein
MAPMSGQLGLPQAKWRALLGRSMGASPYPHTHTIHPHPPTTSPSPTEEGATFLSSPGDAGLIESLDRAAGPPAPKWNLRKGFTAFQFIYMHIYRQSLQMGFSVLEQMPLPRPSSATSDLPYRRHVTRKLSLNDACLLNNSPALRSRESARRGQAGRTCKIMRPACLPCALWKGRFAAPLREQICSSILSDNAYFVWEGSR